MASQTTARTRLGGLALAATLLAAGGCDLFGGDDTETGGTKCGYPTSEGVSGKEIGQSCTADAQCATNFCMMPGDPGNGSNEVFGFCTRGCDCGGGNGIAEEDKSIYECLLVAGDQGRNHHIVVECGSLTDCQDIDPAWTECFNGGSISGFGTLKKVCAAFDN
ncbi:MAG: hypothetical protein H6744_00655 [Deltaproteobacteria bacterium]|nr:hypothetical protein [Deltaproteobacteria bacterium]MCB9785175.1 hypothetical protein [Deltaproteobacteria bacterium]